MMNLNNLRIGIRLGAGFSAVLVLMLAIVVTAYLRLERTAGTLAQMTALQLQARVSQEWLGKTQLNVSRAIAIAKAAGQPDVDQHFTPLIKRTSAEIQELQKSMERAVTSPEGKALMASVAQKRSAYTDLRAQMLELVKQSDQPAVDSLLRDKLLPAAQVYEASMETVQRYQMKEAALGADRLQADIRTGEDTLVALLLAGLALGAAMAWLITRSVTLPLHEAVRTARVIAASDLSRPIDSHRADECGDLLRALGQMQDSLRSLVGQVRCSTESIGTASAQIATGNLDLSSRTEETASNLQQTASSMSQLTDTVKHSADSARHASALASSAAEVAERGGSVVSKVVATMQDINDSSKQIADIVGVIDGIAFQTNILALNAAVEAARAGEQGRGFAVVAGEVRLLARRSAEAAREIKQLIGASVERVEGGSKLVASAGETMQEIVGSVKRVSDIIRTITTAASEQSEGIGQINGSVGELDRMTQQNAALVEQSSAAAESLKEQALNLARVVDTFRLEARSADADQPSTDTPAATAAGTGATAPDAAPGRRVRRQRARRA